MSEASDKLDESKAEKISLITWPGTTITVLMRRFAKVGKDAVQKEMYDTLKAVASVTNPVASNQAYAGVWRVVQVQDGRERRPADEQGIYQTLAIGEFSVVDGTIVANTCGYTVERLFYFDVASIPPLPAASPGVTYEMGPVVENRQLKTWSTYIEVRRARTRNVAQHTISLQNDEIVTRSMILDGYGSFVALSPYAGYVVDRSYDIKANCTADLADVFRQGIPRETTEQERTFLRARAERFLTVQTAPHTPITDAVRGVRMSRRSAPSRFYDRYEVDEQTEAAYPAHVAHWFADAFEAIYLHDYTNWGDIIQPGTAPAGWQYQARNSITDLGYYAATLEARLGLRRGWSFVTQRTAFRARDSYNYRGHPTILTAPEAQGFNSFSASCSLRSDQYYDGEIVHDRLATGAGNGGLGSIVFASERNAFVHGTTADYADWPEPFAAPEDVPGWTFDASCNVTETGYRGNINARAFVSRDWRFQSMNSLLEDRYEYAYRESPGLPIVPAAEQGSVWTAQVSLTEARYYNGSLEQTYFRPYSASSDSLHTLRETRNVYRFEHFRSIPDVPAAVPGYVYALSFDIVPGGIVNGELETRRAHPVSFAFRSFSSRDRQVYSYNYENAASLPSASASPGAGISETIDGGLNGFDLYDYGHRIERELPPWPEPEITWYEDDYRTFRVPVVTVSVSEGTKITGYGSYRNRSTYTMRLFDTAVEAAAFINGANEGSSFSQRGAFWTALKVVKSTVSA